GGAGGSSSTGGSAGASGSSGGGAGQAGAGGSGGTGGGAAATCADITSGAASPKVFWPKPVRAYPNLPFTYTMVAYDEDGHDLCYALEQAPTGMTIDGAGTIHWAPSDADLGAHAFAVEMRTRAGGSARVQVNLEVKTSGFVFVAPNGAPGAQGTYDDPFPTIERGLQALKPNLAKTLIIRGGTYAVDWRWEVSGVSSPTRGAHFTANDPGEVLGYPGERVLIDCQQGSHGLWLYDAEYVIARDLEVQGASASERGGAIATGEHLVFQRLYVHDSDWSQANNCTGFLFHGVENVAHRCQARDNYDRDKSDGPLWNNSNYLTYADDGPDSSAYAIESESSGSVVGFKVKHAGPGAVTFHRVRDEGSTYGFGGMDDGLRIRYSTFIDNDKGIMLGMTDPGPHTDAGDQRIEHNTVIRPQESALMLQYLPREPIDVSGNIFFVDRPFGAAEDTQWMYDLVRYTSDPPLTTLRIDRNCLYAPENDSGFRVGREMESFAAWTARGQDTASVWGEPGFLGASDPRLAPSSPCRFADGTVAGSQP
ncbi:MAG: hypothetical protein OZ921_17950, partial [Sorangiineae bacterium]|nr:hypothetical protein [Sorangiineae bacterium]